MKAIIKSTLVCLMAITAITVSAQPPRGNGEQRTPEQRAKMMTERLTKELNLTETQQKSVYDLNLKMAQQMEQNREKGRADREEMRQQMESRRKEQSAEMKKILNDEQFAKWEKLQSQRNDNRRGPAEGGRRGQGGPRGRN